jgi:membrane protein DedA with SNARE-associated domain
VRVVAAVMAGATRMPWQRFAVANALGAFAWASTVAGSAFALGPAGTAILGSTGIAAVIVATAAAAWRRHRRARRPPAAAAATAG